MSERGNYAVDTDQKIDAEVKRMLNAAHDEARRILRESLHELDELTQRLLVKEVVEGEEIRELLGPIPPQDPDAVPAEIPPPASFSTSQLARRACARSSSLSSQSCLDRCRTRDPSATRRRAVTR